MLIDDDRSGDDRQARHHRGPRPDRPASGCGPTRRCRRTWCCRSTRRPARRRSTRKSSRSSARPPSTARPTRVAAPGRRRPTARKTEALYLPTVEFCSNTTVNPLDPGKIYTGGGLQTYARVPVPDSDGNIGQVRAVKLTDQTEMWQYRQYAPVTTSTLPTGGGVVFVGTLDRKLLAFDDETGEVLWTSPHAQQLARVVPDHLRGRRQAVRCRGRELRQRPRPPAVADPGRQAAAEQPGDALRLRASRR